MSWKQQFAIHITSFELLLPRPPATGLKMDRLGPCALRDELPAYSIHPTWLGAHATDPHWRRHRSLRGWAQLQGHPKLIMGLIGVIEVEVLHPMVSDKV